MSLSREVPTRVGPYAIEAVLGRGGMGTVYLAVADGTRERVALKVLLPEYAENLEYLKRFRREIKACSRLTSPYVVRILGWGEEAGTFYFAMEYLEGGVDLARALKERGRLPQADVANVGVQLCSALDELHRTGVVHRDIKPGNLMLMPDGSVKLMDFGLAKMLDRTSLTNTGEALGSPRYMSPEILRGQPADYRSDIYQVGLLLYECVTGEPAFDGENFDQLLHIILETDAVDVRERLPEVSPDLSTVIRACLRKVPNDRYRTASELAANLEAVRDGRSPMPPSGGRVSGHARLPGGAASAPSDAGGEAPSLAATTGAFLRSPAALTWLPVAAVLLALAFVAFQAWRRAAPAAVDPETVVSPGFRAVEVVWRTAGPAATKLRLKAGDGPVQEHTNAEEPSATTHHILIRGLAPDVRYRAKLAGVRGPWAKKPVEVVLPRPGPPAGLSVTRTGQGVVVRGQHAFPVAAAVSVEAGGRTFGSRSSAPGQGTPAFEATVESVPAWADVERAQLVLTDRYGDSFPVALDPSPGTVTRLLAARAAGDPVAVREALAAFAGTAPAFFSDPSVPAARKTELYRALVEGGAPESTWGPWVEWRAAAEAPSDVSTPPQLLMGPELPCSLLAAPGGPVAGSGLLFVAQLPQAPSPGRAHLRVVRGAVPPGTRLRIAVNEGQEFGDDGTSRGEGEWVALFPSAWLEPGVNRFRFVLDGAVAGGAEVTLRILGLSVPRAGP